MKLKFLNDGEYFAPGISFMLQDIAEINPRSEAKSSIFRYIDLESVSKGKLLKNNIIPAEGAPSRAQRVLQNEDIIFQMVRPYQRNNLFFKSNAGDVQSVASTGYAQLRTKEKFSPEFLYHVLHTDKFTNEVMNRCTGTGYPAINSFALGTIKIIMPPLPEQKKIAAFLSALDENIDLHKRKLELLKKQKAGYIQKIFSRELRFRDNDGNEYPEWTNARLGDLGEWQKSYSFSRAYETSYGEYKHLHYGDIHSFNRTNINSKYLNYVNIDIRNDNLIALSSNNVIFADASEDLENLGKSTVVHGENLVVSGLHTLNLLVKKSKILPLFLVYYTQSDDYKRFIRKNGIGTSVYGISKKNLSNLEVMLPSLQEQAKIVEFITKLELNAIFLKDYLKLLTEKKRAYSQLLFV